MVLAHGVGDRLIDLCQTFQLVIGGTVFPHKEIHKYTWTSPNGHTRNQIDHICISRKWRRSIMDVRNRRSASIDSDHELIIGELLIKLRRNSNTVSRTTRRPPPINVQRLSDSNLSTRMATALREQMTAQLLNHSWEQTCSILRSTAEEMLGTRQRRRTDWISAHTWELISKRNSSRRTQRAVQDGEEISKKRQKKISGQTR
ncbi:craniofacial development protein 2-like [Drosophila bipectinata]|uniref:craniofacial development protein 2-like n=1 Tax=Drosophila bipectinata TaxID=42026 RepID=UPI0038B36EA1